jgi:hypothetical protein
VTALGQTVTGTVIVIVIQSDSDGKRHESSLITDIQVSLIHKVTSVVYYYYYYYHYYYYWYNVWSRSTACEVHE